MNTLLKDNNYSQFIKVFQWPIGSNVKQSAIPKGYDNNKCIEDTNGVVIY